MRVRERLLCLMLLCVLAGCASMPPAVNTDHISVVFAKNAVSTSSRNAPVESDKTRRAWQAVLARHIAERTALLLPAGDTLTVDITLIERAGGFEPWRGAQAGELRIVRDSYPAKIDLTFVQTGRDGTVVRQGQRALRDPHFMMQLNRYHSEPLRYEKALLDTWINSTWATLTGK
jgi:hypothetical protein